MSGCQWLNIRNRKTVFAASAFEVVSRVRLDTFSFNDV